MPHNHLVLLRVYDLLSLSISRTIDYHPQQEWKDILSQLTHYIINPNNWSEREGGDQHIIDPVNKMEEEAHDQPHAEAFELPCPFP